MAPILRVLTAGGVLRSVGLDDLTDGMAPVRVGADQLGSADYPIPGGALFVAPTGSNANPGTIGSPKQTLAGAISAATSGQTVVLRGGEYRENAGSTAGKALTIQNYPGEAVWFDGSDVVTGWTESGGRWWVPTIVEFSHIAGHSQASPDSPSRWTDSQNPVAHWVDLVFVDGVRQWRVASNPGPGQFTVDYTAHRIWIGSNPSGKEVRVSTRNKMLHVNSTCTIRGIGWRRYSTEMYELGTVYIATAGAGSRVENCHMVDVATQPLCVIGPNTAVDQCTIVRPGQTGVHVNRADGATFTRLHITEHNWEKFRTQPHCGGIKVTFTGDVTIADNLVDGATNRAVSIWLDASNWGGKIVRNSTLGGYGGIFVEASGDIIVAGNRMRGNATTYHGLLLTISQDMAIWNNVANIANGYLFANWQDDRQATFPGERFWAEGLRWHAVRNTFCNNVLGGSHALYQFYNRRDTPAVGFFSYGDMLSHFEGNVFSATAGQNPPLNANRLAGLADGPVNNYSTVSALRAAYGSAISINNAMTAIQDPDDAAMATFVGAVPLPADVAEALGVETGATVVGPLSPAPIPKEG